MALLQWSMGVPGHTIEPILERSISLALLALMQEPQEKPGEIALDVARVDSTLSTGEAEHADQAIQQGTEFVYVAPEELEKIAPGGLRAPSTRLGAPVSPELEAVLLRHLAKRAEDPPVTSCASGFVRASRLAARSRQVNFGCQRFRSGMVWPERTTCA
jgi:hypothetical protein